MKKLVLCLLLPVILVTACHRAQVPQPAAAAPKATAVTPPAMPVFSAEARALYDEMIRAYREAQTLSYRSTYSFGGNGYLSRASYQVWMKKPNYAQLESTGESENVRGILVLDGSRLWTWWPTGKPQFTLKDKAFGTDFYMVDEAPPGQHSIGHAVMNLGTGMSMTILDPSTFHLYTDSLQPYIDGVASLGTEVVNGQTLDRIEVSIMDHQRSWYLWLSRKDHLPRKLHEVVRVDYEIAADETWSDVRVNAPIATSMFRWSPPAGWTQYHLPGMEEGLLAVGSPAPDFDLASARGKSLRLSSYRGKVVWLVFWRVGCPPCREEFPHLQQVAASYGRKGVVVIGYNCADDRTIALDFMKECGVTFPNVLDTSSQAQEICFSRYQTMGWSAVPMNYLIDRAGRVAAAWYGYDPGDQQGERTIDRLLESGG